VLVGVEHELVIRVGVVAAVHEPEIPPGEDARGGVDVELVVVADPKREELHDLAAEVLLRALPRVQATIEPEQHRWILGDRDQQIAKAAERHRSKQLDLTLRARQFAGLEGHHARGLRASRDARDLRVRSGEVVVPEERHLLFQRPSRVQHPEQPSLPRVLDIEVR
jgi:hypothetical protein